MKRLATCLAFCALCSGCSFFEPHRDSSIFYTLCEHSSAEWGGACNCSRTLSIINLAIDEIPAYADSPYIVVKSRDNRLIFSETNRWAEPLGAACARVLQSRLSAMLGDRAMVISSTHTIGNTLTCDYRLAIDFDDIIYNCATKEVIVKCTWSLFDYDRKQQQLMHRFVGSEHVEEESFDSIVVALKHALWHIAADIAHAVKQLPLDVKDEDMAAFATGDDESPSGQCQQCSN